MLEKKRGAPRRRTETRREFLTRGKKIALGFATTAAVSTGIFGYNRFQQNRELESSIEKISFKATELQPFLDEFEEGFDKFTDIAGMAIDKSVENPELRKLLFTPLALYIGNKGNPHRNIYTFRADFLRTDQSSIRIKSNHFFYDREESGIRTASFDPQARTLFLPPGYKGKNLLDNVHVAHELLHVAQNMKDYAELPKEVIEAFHKLKGRKAIDVYEAQAFGLQLDLINIILEGRLREDVLSGKDTIPIYRQILNTSPQQDTDLTSMLTIAKLYYNTNSTPLKIDEKFTSHISNIYRSGGSSIFTRTSNGYQPVVGK